jgi:hypothetical protein
MSDLDRLTTVVVLKPHYGKLALWDYWEWGWGLIKRLVAFKLLSILKVHCFDSRHEFLHEVRCE